MDILAGIAIGIALCVIWFVWTANRIIAKLEREVTAELVEKASDKMVGLVVERVSNTIYCYSEKDNEFVCQGTTLEELRTAFKQRFPDRTGYIAGGDPDTVENLKKQLELVKNENSTGI
jgi:hypothetical protein